MEKQEIIENIFPTKPSLRNSPVADTQPGRCRRRHEQLSVRTPLQMRRIRCPNVGNGLLLRHIPDIQFAAQIAEAGQNHNRTKGVVVDGVALAFAHLADGIAFQIVEGTLGGHETIHHTELGRVRIP